MRPAYDVIVLGDYFYDLIYTGLPEFPVLGREIDCAGVTTTGGALFTTVVALHRLGAKVGWPAYFGNDYYSQSVYDFAVAEGVDLTLARRVDRPYRRVTTALPLHGERAFVTYTDPDADDLYEHWFASLRACDFRHVHLGGMDCLDKVEPLIQYVRERGATLSTDCQDGEHLQKPCKCREMIEQVDVFLPNARESLIVAEVDTIMEALRQLAQRVGQIVVKDGANGAWAADGDTITHVPPIQAGPVIDTTGAGDCFNAGFLYGYVVEHAPLETCARYGNICGGLSVTGVGGATNAPTRAELLDWLAGEPPTG